MRHYIHAQGAYWKSLSENLSDGIILSAPSLLLVPLMIELYLMQGFT